MAIHRRIMALERQADKSYHPPLPHRLRRVNDASIVLARWVADRRCALTTKRRPTAAAARDTRTSLPPCARCPLTGGWWRRRLAPDRLLIAGKSRAVAGVCAGAP